MWTPSEAVQKAQSPLERGDVVGHVQQDRTGLGFGTSWAMWHKSISDAGPVNQLGKTETSQAQLEGSLENGRKQTQLYNQSHLQYPPYSPKRPLVKWRRPYVCSLPNSSNSQAKKACPKATTPRNVQLPQPGPATNGHYLIISLSHYLKEGKLMPMPSLLQWSEYQASFPSWEQENFLWSHRQE